MGASKYQPLEARISHGIVDFVAMQGNLEKKSFQRHRGRWQLILQMFIICKNFLNPLSSLILKGKREAWRSWVSFLNVPAPRDPQGYTLEPFSPLNTPLYVAGAAEEL